MVAGCVVALSGGKRLCTIKIQCLLLHGVSKLRGQLCKMRTDGKICGNTKRDCMSGSKPFYWSLEQLGSFMTQQDPEKFQKGQLCQLEICHEGMSTRLVAWKKSLAIAAIC